MLLVVIVRIGQARIKVIRVGGGWHCRSAGALGLHDGCLAPCAFGGVGSRCFVLSFLPTFFACHASRQQLREAIVIKPLVVSLEKLDRVRIVGAKLELEVVGQMSLGGSMGQQVGDIAELRLSRTDDALEGSAHGASPEGSNK